MVDPRTVQGPDGRNHDVLDAIEALPWTAQLCPLMRHEYTIWGKGPEWAWNVLSAMLLAQNPASFRAYFRGYPSANRYWDAPDGRRYWRGRFEIDRGEPDGVGQRTVDEGGRAARDWDGPPHAPNGIGLYEKDVNDRWWPTRAALEAGYLPCSSCELTARKSTVAVVPSEPARGPELIAAAQADSLRQAGRPLNREELERALRQFPEMDVSGPKGSPRRLETSVARAVATPSPEIRAVIERLLDLREAEAPLGHTGYRGPFTQKVIAQIAGVPVRTVTTMAIERDRRRIAGKPR
jgi:hypothetical protein